MAMQLDNSRPSINVTPLIDVLLVLLIIFLIITPTEPVGLNARLPQESSDSAPRPPSNDVVIQTRKDRSVWINQQPVADGELDARLRAVAAMRPNGVVFLHGAKGLEFGDVARVMDAARGAGLFQVALVTAEL